MKNRAVIRSLFFPVTQEPLLLPSVVLAEVISYRMFEYLPGSPSWVLGLIEWRGISLPVISFEELRGRPAPKNLIGARIAILNGITGNSRLDFFGLRIQGIPRLILVREGDLILRDDPAINAEENSSLYLAITIAAQSALIPNIKAIETQLASFMLQIN